MDILSSVWLCIKQKKFVSKHPFCPTKPRCFVRQYLCPEVFCGWSFFLNCSPGFPSQYTEGGATTRVSGGAKSVGEDAGKHAERCSLCDRAEEEDRRLGQRGGQEGKLCKDAGVSTLSLFLLPTAYEPSRFVRSTGEIWAAFFHILSPSCLELLSNSQMHNSDTFSSFKNNSLWNNPPIKKNFRYVRIFQMFFLPCK